MRGIVILRLFTLVAVPLMEVVQAKDIPVNGMVPVRGIVPLMEAVQAKDIPVSGVVLMEVVQAKDIPVSGVVLEAGMVPVKEVDTIITRGILMEYL